MSDSARRSFVSKWQPFNVSSAKATGRRRKLLNSTRRLPTPRCRPKRKSRHVRMRRYERMPEAAAEAGMVRSYLDWLIELPWAVQPEKAIDISEARRVLDEDHFGLQK